MKSSDLPAAVLARALGMKPRTVAASKPRGMNKWEKRYADHLGYLKLAGDILWFDFEPVRLRIGVGAYYRPDFLVMTPTGIEAHEVKGFAREAAMVRLKVAADRHPWCKFIIVRKNGNGWKYQTVGAGNFTG